MSTTRGLAVGLGLTFALGTAAAWAEPERTTPPPPPVLEVTSGPVAAGLYPGATDGDLVIDVANHGPDTLRLVSLTATTVTTGDAACPGEVVYSDRSRVSIGSLRA